MRPQIAIVLVLVSMVLGTAGLALAGYPQDAEAVFKAANEAYRANDFEKAATLYHEIETSGVISPDLFYNLGTTYAQLGKTGEAVAYLEKARRLAPYDKDIVANLEMVSPPTNTSRPFVLLVPFVALRDGLGAEEWMWLTTATFAFSALLWSTFLFLGKKSVMRQWTTWATLVLCVICAVFAGWSYYTTYLTRFVVTRTESPVYSGPSQAFSRLMTAKEGQKFPALPYDNPQWKRVELPTGQTGFIQAQHTHEI